MKRIEHFVPANRDEGEAILSRLLWPIPPGVSQTYVEAYTEPGAMVLMPYCQGSACVQETLAAGRRALAVNFDPTVMLVVETALTPLPARQVDAAVARLGDSTKQGVPLRHYLEGLYATICPACLRQAVADYFIWDREQDTPVAKSLQCRACGWDGQAAVDPEDRKRLAEVPVGGMHYHYVLGRVIPRTQEDTLRVRVEPLLKLYSPRNLYALAELTLRLESLFPDGLMRRTLNVLLLDCLDRCSSLTPVGAGRGHRRGLSRPRRFLERNVWRAYEEAVTRLQASSRTSVSGLADTFEAFQTGGEEWDGFVGRGLVRELARSLPPRSIQLILASPPPLNSAAWTLSYFWGSWLLGAEAVDALRPLLRQRTPDAAWYARVMSGSFRNLASLLGDEGRLVLILTQQRPAVVEALLLAASRARLGTASLVQCAADYRLELTPRLPEPATVSDTSLEAEIRQTTVRVATETIRSRGEPTAWRTLHAAIQGRLAETDLLTRALGAEGLEHSPFDLVAAQVQEGLEDPILVRLRGKEGDIELWWLANPTNLDSPLSDRVERGAYEVLQDTVALTEADFTKALYRRFPGSLTPETALVAACLRSYGREVTPAYWQLRPEDLPDARRTERQDIIEDLLTLGHRLGYETAPWGPFDAAWFEATQVRAAFAVCWQAAISEALGLGDQLGGARPYMVIPGGRAVLVSYKLAHNPVWQATVDEQGWRFIKYRHVRKLVARPDVDEYALRTVVGLDPIVEQESAQLSLF